MRTIRFTVLALTATTLASPAALANNVGTYLSGSTYLSAPAAGAENCASQCAGDAQCRGWNFFRQNSAGGICEFNSQITASSAHPHAISGLSEQSSDLYTDRIVSGGTHTVRIGQPAATAAPQPQAPAARTIAARTQPASTAARPASSALNTLVRQRVFSPNVSPSQANQSAAPSKPATLGGPLALVRPTYTNSRAARTSVYTAAPHQAAPQQASPQQAAPQQAAPSSTSAPANQSLTAQQNSQRSGAPSITYPAPQTYRAAAPSIQSATDASLEVQRRALAMSQAASTPQTNPTPSQPAPSAAARPLIMQDATSNLYGSLYDEVPVKAEPVKSPLYSDYQEPAANAPIVTTAIAVPAAPVYEVPLDLNKALAGQ